MTDNTTKENILLVLMLLGIFVCVVIVCNALHPIALPHKSDVDCNNYSYNMGPDKPEKTLTKSLYSQFCK